MPDIGIFQVRHEGTWKPVESAWVREANAWKQFYGVVTDPPDEEPPPSIAPAFTTAPTIAGTPALGQTLTSTSGMVTGTPTPVLTRQWKRNGASISGATGTTYVVQQADVGTALTIIETATNVAGIVSSTSNSLAVAADAPIITSSPSQSIATGQPFALELLANVPVNWAIVGGKDASYFDLNAASSGAQPFDFNAPVDVNPTDNVYEITVRATSIANGLTADQAVTVAVTTVDALDFALTPSAVSAAATVSTAIGTLAESVFGAREKIDFTLTPSIVPDTAVAGASIGELG